MPKQFVLKNCRYTYGWRELQYLPDCKCSELDHVFLGQIQHFREGVWDKDHRGQDMLLKRRFRELILIDSLTRKVCTKSRFIGPALKLFKNIRSFIPDEQTNPYSHVVSRNSSRPCNWFFFPKKKQKQKTNRALTTSIPVVTLHILTCYSLQYVMNLTISVCCRYKYRFKQGWKMWSINF